MKTFIAINTVADIFSISLFLNDKFKDSIEINRIVEFPIETLERDIYKIINEIEYKNAYY